MTDHSDLLRRLGDNIAIGKDGRLVLTDEHVRSMREAADAIEAESKAADMIAEERDAWERRAKALEAENAALRQLLADMKPHWDGFTRKVIWTAAMSGVMADIRTRLDAAMLAGKKP